MAKSKDTFRPRASDDNISDKYQPNCLVCNYDLTKQSPGGRGALFHLACKGCDCEIGVDDATPEKIAEYKETHLKKTA